MTESPPQPTTAIATQSTGTALIDVSGFNAAELDVLRSTIAKGATDDQLRLFLTVALRSGLDPFRQEIYASIMTDQRSGEPQLVIMTGVEGYRSVGMKASRATGRAIVARHGPVWCGPDGEWRDVWLADELPAAARFTITVEGEDPYPGTALMKESMQYTSGGQPTRFWKSQPVHMLGVAAERQAWKLAFPHELAAFTDTELPDGGSPAAPAAPARQIGARRSGPRSQTQRARPPARDNGAPSHIGQFLQACHDDLGLTSSQVHELLQVTDNAALTAYVDGFLDGDWSEALRLTRERIAVQVDRARVESDAGPEEPSDG